MSALPISPRLSFLITILVAGICVLPAWGQRGPRKEKETESKAVNQQPLAFSKQDLEAERVFTDLKGQAVTGKVRSVGAGSIVTLDRQGGGMIKVKVSDLSLDDRKFIDAWYTDKVLSLGRTLSFSAKPHKGDVNEQTVMKTTMTEQEAYYDVTLKSLAVLPLQELKVVHRTYKKSDTGERGESAERVYQEGTEAVAELEPGKEVEFASAKQKLQSSKLDPDFEYVSGAKRTTQDRLRGVWVRVYKNDVLIGEFAEPKALTEIETWDPVPAK